MTRGLILVRQSLSALVAVLARAGRTIVTEIGPDGALLACGLLLLGYGAWLAYPPAGFIVPGLILVLIAMPSRPPFVIRPRVKRSRESS